MFKNIKNVAKAVSIYKGILYMIAGYLFISISLSIFKNPVAPSFIFPFCLFAGGYTFNLGLGLTILGDEYKLHRSSRNRELTFEPKETPKFLKRRKIVTLIGTISYVMLSIYYLIRLIILFFGSYDTFDLVELIISIIVSLCFGICIFNVYRRTRYIKLKGEK